MPAPYSAGQARPHLPVPPGACDAHMHLFDPDLPFAPTATLVHGRASVHDYQRLQARLGTARCVVVQPSSYGCDHRVMVAGLRALGEAARGIAVVTPTATPAELRTLADCGVVGTRFNLVQQGVTDVAMVGEVAALARDLGWHLQFHLRPASLLSLAQELAELPVPVVIDHYGQALADPTLAEAVWQTLDRLLSTGRVWVKLSAPYIACPHADMTDALGKGVTALAQRHAERLVWGSDWPHVTESVKPDDAQWLDVLSGWLIDERTRTRVLVDNPALLYGF